MNINNENMQERGIKSLGNIADDYMKSMNELCGSLEKLTSTLETMTYMAEQLKLPRRNSEWQQIFLSRNLKQSMEKYQH